MPRGQKRPPVTDSSASDDDDERTPKRRTRRQSPPHEKSGPQRKSKTKGRTQHARDTKKNRSVDFDGRDVPPLKEHLPNNSVPPNFKPGPLISLIVELEKAFAKEKKPQGSEQQATVPRTDLPHPRRPTSTAACCPHSVFVKDQNLSQQEHNGQPLVHSDSKAPPLPTGLLGALLGFNNVFGNDNRTHGAETQLEKLQSSSSGSYSYDEDHSSSPPSPRGLLGGGLTASHSISDEDQLSSSGSPVKQLQSSSSGSLTDDEAESETSSSPRGQADLTGLRKVVENVQSSGTRPQAKLGPSVPTSDDEDNSNTKPSFRDILCLMGFDQIMGADHQTPRTTELQSNSSGSLSDDEEDSEGRSDSQTQLDSPHASSASPKSNGPHSDVQVKSQQDGLKEKLIELKGKLHQSETQNNLRKPQANLPHNEPQAKTPNTSTVLQKVDSPHSDTTGKETGLQVIPGPGVREPRTGHKTILPHIGPMVNSSPSAPAGKQLGSKTTSGPTIQKQLITQAGNNKNPGNTCKAEAGPRNQLVAVPEDDPHDKFCLCVKCLESNY